MAIRWRRAALGLCALVGAGTWSGGSAGSSQEPASIRLTDADQPGAAGRWVADALPGLSADRKRVAVLDTAAGPCGDIALIVLDVATGRTVRSLPLRRCDNGEVLRESPGVVAARLESANQLLARGGYGAMTQLPFAISPDNEFGRSGSAAPLTEYSPAAGTLTIRSTDNLRHSWTGKLAALRIHCPPGKARAMFPTHVRGWVSAQQDVLLLRSQVMGAQDDCDDPHAWRVVVLEAAAAP